jgi:hypothetical protein
MFVQQIEFVIITDFENVWSDLHAARIALATVVIDNDLRMRFSRRILLSDFRPMTALGQWPLDRADLEETEGGRVAWNLCFIAFLLSFRPEPRCLRRSGAINAKRFL